MRVRQRAFASRDRLVTTKASGPPLPWGFLVPLATSQLVTYGALYYTFPVLLVPMEQDLGLSRPEVSLAFTIGLCLQTASSYAVGYWIDRHGGRTVMTFGMLAGAVLLGLWAFVDGLWQLYAIWALIGIVSSTVLYEAAFATATRRLGDDYRIGITVITLVGGFASTVFVPLVTLLVSVSDWRSALIAVALLNVPMAALIHVALRELPAGVQELPDRNRSSCIDATTTTSRRRPVLYCLGLSYAAFAFMYTAMLVHLLPLLQELGLPPAASVIAYAVIGPSQFLGRLLVLVLERRRMAKVVGLGLVANLLAVAAIACLLGLPSTVPWTLVAALLFGAGMGVKTIVQATAASELLGRTGYGAIQGLLAIPALLAQAVAPYASASIWSFSGGYAGLLGVMLASALLSLLGFAGAAGSARRG
jgi:MFS family permease